MSPSGEVDLAEARRFKRAGAPDDGWRRQRLFDGLRRLLSAAAKIRPVAVVVEDVQWADPTTLEFLDYLLAPGHPPGLPVVLTCRSDEEPTPALTAWLEQLHRDTRVRRLDLSGLTQAETAEQIALLLGQPVPRQFADDIYLRSEGNAFFTEQLVAFERPDSENPTIRESLPAGLTALLLSRTRQVTGPARDAMVALAVAARPMPESALAQLCRTDEATVRATLRDLLSARLLRRPDRAGRHQLRHALLAEAVGGELLPGERRDLHARVAELMAGWPDSGLAAEVATHFAAAEVPTEELRWRVLAARVAEAVFASKEAAGHWRRAITLWDRVPEPEVVTSMDLTHLYLRAMTSAESCGEGPSAAGLAQEALARLAATASPETAVSLYGKVGHFRIAESTEAGLEALGTAIQIGEQLRPSTEYIAALHDYAFMMQTQGWFDDQHALTTRALQAAQQTGDLTEQKLLLVELGWAAMAQGNRKDALTSLEDALKIITKPDDPSAEAHVAVHHTGLLLKLGELERVIQVGLTAIDRAHEVGESDSWRTNCVRSYVCEALTELGEIDQAAAIIDPVTEGTPTRDARRIHVDRADLDMRRGHLSTAMAFWEANRELVGSVDNWEDRHDFALRHLELDLWLGHPTATLPAAFSVLDLLYRTDASRFAGGLLVLAARACADAAEHARAKGGIDDLQAAAEGGERLSSLLVLAKVDPFAAGPVPVTATADGLSWQAELGRLQGRSDATDWKKASAAWDALTRPHGAAYARWRQAEALLTRRHGRTPAAAVLRTAAAQARQHMPLSNAIHDLARRARIDITQLYPSTQADEPIQAAAFGLTERELAVLQLLGQGKTNREIGAELFISAKTASVHVTNILRKLKVNSRVQAAAVAAHAHLLTSADTTDKWLL